jgi:endo-1,4-beta-xylanase
VLIYSNMKFPLAHTIAICLVVLLIAVCAPTVSAQSTLQAQLATRPVTPDDITAYGLPTTTELTGQTPQPHAGWKLVPGGENLIANAYWDTSGAVSETNAIEVSNGILTASTGNGYLGQTNVLAPRLYTKGDFGLVGTIQTAPGTSGLITLTGSLNTGAQSWQGMTEVEFGVENSGNYVFAYWDGTQSSPVVFKTLKGFGTPPTGTLTMELLHQQGQFFLYFNGVQYGPIADPGLFSLGYAIPGIILYPGQQMKLTQLAFEVPLADTSAQLTTPIGLFPYRHPGDSLASLAAVTGRTFGTQVSSQQLALGRYGTGHPGVTGGAPDPTYAPRVVAEFNPIVAASFYYEETERAQGSFVLGDGDSTIAAAKANGLSVHCHHLIGPNIYNPNWLVNGKFTADQLTAIMKTHIQTVMGHFKGQCASWDVVNEALNPDGTLDTSSDNIWAQTIGPSYIDIAFQTAHHADPGAKLYYNSNTGDNQTTGDSGLYSLIAGMQQRGTPIDGVGLQCHLTPGTNNLGLSPNHDSMVANMAQLAKMGLSVRISELDMRIPLPVTSAGLADQASAFSTVVQACLDSPNCVSITVWGADDTTSWIPYFPYYPGYGAATLFDEHFQPKPAYTSVMNTLRKAALAVPSAPKLTAPAVTNAASYAAKGVAPGEIVVLFPTNVGPASFAGNSLDAAGKVVTMIAGTRVLFDGIAAPMIYAAKNQVSAVVPYEIAGQSSTQVQVEYNGIRSVAVTVPVLPAVPGILTANSSGTGQAVAVNQDGSLNSAANPAARGSVVILYATGEGQRNPAGLTGVPAPANASPVMSPATLTVGGAAATLGYAASAPGFIGLMQINLTVPAATTTGASVPVVLTIGTAQSPSGVTIAIK